MLTEPVQYVEGIDLALCLGLSQVNLQVLLTKPKYKTFAVST